MLAEEVRRALGRRGYTAKVMHRDIEKSAA
jgi:hypothetical protein